MAVTSGADMMGGVFQVRCVIGMEARNFRP